MPLGRNFTIERLIQSSSSSIDNMLFSKGTIPFLRKVHLFPVIMSYHIPVYAKPSALTWGDLFSTYINYWKFSDQSFNELIFFS
jgi:hypothetical protein